MTEVDGHKNRRGDFFADTSIGAHRLCFSADDSQTVCQMFTDRRYQGRGVKVHSNKITTEKILQLLTVQIDVVPLLASVLRLLFPILGKILEFSLRKYTM